MCRWFAYIAPKEECLLEDVLVTPAHAISKQVDHHYLPFLLSHDPAVHAGSTTAQEIAQRNQNFSVDGFGMAWYTATRGFFSNPHKSQHESSSSSSSSPSSEPILHPTLFKITKPALHDTNFQAICANTATTCVLSHIRAASTGVIADVNNHPFVFGRHTIMHNGYISDFHSVGRQMEGLMSEECYANNHGRTDSEALAGLYMTYLTAGEPPSGVAAWERTYTTAAMLDALQNAINTVVDLQQKALGERATPNDLNVCVTDGRRLVAARFRNHATEQPPSLYWSNTAGVTLNRMYPDVADGPNGRWGKATQTLEATHGLNAEGHNPHQRRRVKEHGRHIIVASEPTTYKKCEWNLIEKNHALLVEADGTECFRELVDVGRK